MIDTAIYHARLAPRLLNIEAVEKRCHPVGVGSHEIDPRSIN